jgi:hypothetical protein
MAPPLSSVKEASQLSLYCEGGQMAQPLSSVREASQLSSTVREARWPSLFLL